MHGRGLNGSFWLTTVTVVLFVGTEAQACPMCKLAVETDAPQPAAYLLSIFFMLGMVATVGGSVFALASWISRQERQRLIEAGYGHLFENAVTELAAGTARTSGRTASGSRTAPPQVLPGT